MPTGGRTAIGLGAAEFTALRAAYVAGRPFRCGACTSDGEGVYGDAIGTAGERALAISEALRWGEPVVLPTDGGFLWALPLTRNQRVLGGLIAGLAEADCFPAGAGAPAVDVRAACRDLLERAVAADLTNAALLAARREHHQRERARAEAIHEAKAGHDRGALDGYLREEPELVRSIRAGDRARARGILNRILVGIYHRGGGDLALVKSLLLELVVMMSRTAVESGGDSGELLGRNWQHLRGLHDAADEEALARWLVAQFDRGMDSIARHKAEPSDVLLRDALRFIADHCDEDLDRAAVARAAGCSPAAFSRLLQQRHGRGFADTLNQARIDRAKRLLVDSPMDLLQVALEVGFKDPSYFTKVFRRHEAMTPSEYRARNRGR